MSDGWLRGRGTKSCRICIESINKEYLEYLSNLFGCLGSSIKLKRSASDSAKHARDTGFRPNAKKENYSDIYYWQTRSMPELKRFASWYSEGKKIWPKSLNLESRVLKHLYCGDGTYERDKNKMSISLRKEKNNKEKIEHYFRKSKLPEPKWHEPLDENGDRQCNIYWYSEDCDEIFDYMGEAPPGFEYKWPK